MDSVSPYNNNNNNNSNKKKDNLESKLRRIKSYLSFIFIFLWLGEI